LPQCGILARPESAQGQKPALPRRSIGVRFALNKQTLAERVQCDAMCRFCCKSLFALLIKNSFGRRRDFRVKMWGTSSPEVKLTCDLGNVIEATSIGGRRSDFFTAGKLAPGNLGLLQQYLPKPDSRRAAKINLLDMLSTRARSTDKTSL
jgi:hypothetical protein